MTTQRFYRDKHNGKILGVCAGIAEYTEINVLWVRLATVALVFMGMGLVVPAYFMLGLLAAKKPYHNLESWDQPSRQAPPRSSTATKHEVRSKLRAIDKRLAAVERFYVDGNARLAAEIERLR